jgi:hypothetical protein
MKKETVRKIEIIESDCYNNDKIELFEKAVAFALSENLKYGTKHFLGTVRLLVARQEAGFIVLA